MAAMAQIRVLLVDDQALVRAGFAMLINSQPDLWVVGQAADGRAATALAAQLRPDIILMDIRMPTMDGIAATAEIAAAGPLPKIVVLTTFDLDEHALGALRAGASGFLLKGCPPEELLAAIRTVYSGDAVIAPSTTRRLLRHLATPAVKPKDPALETLTAREIQVLIAMARGWANSEIATELCVAEGTIKTHVSHILTKLSARDRVQAVVQAYESGLVQPGTG